MTRDSSGELVVLALVSDAYGGRGGIALYTRNLLKAICTYPAVENVVVIPRSVTYRLETLPQKLTYITAAAGGKLNYLKHCIRQALTLKKVDLIVCGHLHLLPFAYLFKLLFRCPVIPVVYGVEAWTPTSHRSVNFLCARIESFISIRKLTAQKLNAWSGRKDRQYFYLPNCIDGSKYGVAPKRQDLVGKYGLSGKRIIMTAGRLDAIEYDRNKGFDEVLDVLPDLHNLMPNIMYLILGDGDDKARLETKARQLGVADIVAFTGYVPDEEKADHYRLADVFAMPGSNPIFDRYPFRFVFLEALACGIPVVGCRLEDESEANDPDANELIIQVDPDDREDIKRGIMLGLEKGRNYMSRVESFYFEPFEKRVHDILDEINTHCDVS